MYRILGQSKVVISTAKKTTITSMAIRTAADDKASQNAPQPLADDRETHEVTQPQERSNFDANKTPAAKPDAFLSLFMR